MEDNEDAARDNVDFTAGIAPLAIGIKHRESVGELWRDVVRQKLAPFLRIHDCHVELCAQPLRGRIDSRRSPRFITC
jgi:hypothetical protein